MTSKQYLIQRVAHLEDTLCTHIDRVAELEAKVAELKKPKAKKEKSK